MTQSISRKPSEEFVNLKDLTGLGLYTQPLVARLTWIVFDME